MGPTQVDQRRGQGEDKVRLVLGRHVGCSPLLSTLLRLLALLLTLGCWLLGLLLLLGHCSLWWLLSLIGLRLWRLLGLLLICCPCRLHDRCCLCWCRGNYPSGCPGCLPGCFANGSPGCCCCSSGCCCLLLASSPSACLQSGLDHALELELELSRGASDYAEPPWVTWELIWIDGHSGCQAGCLIPNLDFRVLLFAGVAESAQSLAIHVNRRSTSPAHSYSCCGLVMGTRRVIP